MAKKIIVLAISLIAAVFLFCQPALALDELAISCESFRCVGGGVRTFQYTLINNSPNPVTMATFYMGTEDLNAGNYSNWIAPPGFAPTGLVADWVTLGGMGCSIMGTNGLQTPHGVAPVGQTFSSAGGILWTGNAILQPGQTATFGFDHPYDYQDVEWFSDHPGPAPNVSQSYYNPMPIAGPTGVYTNGWIHGPSNHAPEQGDRDYGDAPEEAMAYPSLGIMGQFPTCITVGPAFWIEHTNFGALFGQDPTFIDFEADGNAGSCPGFNPYDQDECFLDGDAGLITPPSYTIVGGNEVPCNNSGSLGITCNTAAWGPSIDIDIYNMMPGHEPYLPAYVNVLVDWNQDGVWNGSSACPNGSVPEHVLVNFIVPAMYIGPLSALAPPNFTIGPNSGYVWVRFTISEKPVPNDWNGEGAFEDGETEDYLLLIDDPPPAPAMNEWGMFAFFILIAGTAIFTMRKKLVK